MRTYFKSGAWNAVCDRCGFQFKSDELRDEWTGLKVCHKCWEPRHPQDLIRIPREDISTPWSRPVDDTSGMLVCNFVNAQGKAGVGVAGCARCGSINP